MVRQSTGLLFCGVLLSACGDLSTPKGSIKYLSIKGGVVSDEPLSALVGKHVLTSGGNAVDALVAMYFALSVTYPVSGTLGGGGICIVHNGKDGTTATVDFRPGKYTIGNRTAVIPGVVRGLYTLHARFGRTKWEKLLIPAEKLARFGFPVSRAFARKIAKLPPDMFFHPTIRELFISNNMPLTEGKKLIQRRLSAIIEKVRLSGPTGFYTGNIARDLIVGLEKTTNIAVPAAALKSYRPTWSVPKNIAFGNRIMFVPGGRIGTKAVTILGAVIQGRYSPIILPNGTDSAGLSTIDVEGNAVACVVSANGALGAQRMIGSTGILMAKVNPDEFPGLPILFAHKYLNDALGVVTGAGGLNARAIAISRAVSAFIPGIEPHQSPEKSEVTTGIRTNVIQCPEGSRRAPMSCEFIADPRGSGLALSASN